jgi:hypothetical protein
MSFVIFDWAAAAFSLFFPSTLGIPAAAAFCLIARTCKALAGRAINVPFAVVPGKGDGA